MFQNIKCTFVNVKLQVNAFNKKAKGQNFEN